MTVNVLAARCLVAAVILLSGCDSQTPQELISSGKQLEAQKDLPAAIIQYKAAIQRDLGNPEPRVLLGKALLAAGDVNGAVLELSKALEDKASPDEVMPTLARAMVLARSYRKLVNEYGNVKLEDPRAIVSFQRELAEAWGMIGNRGKAEAAIEAALSAVPEDPAALILRARVHAGQNRFEQAESIVESVLSRNPSDPDALLLKGELLFAWRRDPAGAEAAFLKAAGARPELVAAHSSVVSLRLRRGDLEGARAQAAAFRAALPGHHHQLMVDAQLAYAEGRFAQARESIQGLLRLFPDHEEALALSGGIEARLGSLIQASAQLGKALSLQPDHQAARVTLAEVESRLGQHARALTTLRPLLEEPSPPAAALAVAGNAELRLGRPAAAQRLFQRAAALDPKDIRHRTAAVVARLAMGDALQALNELESLAKGSDSIYADEALFAARLSRGELDAALASLDEMSRKRPVAAGPHEMRGRVLLMRRDLPGARAAFERSLKVDPAFYAATANLVLVDLLENKPDQAATRLRKAIETDPRNSQAMLTLGELLARQGAPVAEVKQTFAAAVAAAPAEAEPRLKLIEYTLRRRQLKDALTFAQDALATLPGDVRVLEAAGNAQLQAGEIEQAINSFRRLAGALPDSPQPYLKLADAYQLSNAREQMLSAVKKALEVAPESAEAQTALIDALMRTGQSGAALEYARRIRSAKPEQPGGYALEAVYHARNNNDPAAITALREGVERTRSPDLARKYYSQLLKSKRLTEAERFGASWMRDHPKDAAFEYLISVADIARGDLKSAEARLRRVVAVYRDNVIALNNLAWVLVQTGQTGALEYAQRAVNLSPDRPELMDTLAMALAADKQLPAALQLQRRAIELAPEDPGLRLGLARLALQAGDKSLAREELDRLEKLGDAFPGQGTVRELKQRL